MLFLSTVNFVLYQKLRVKFDIFEDPTLICQIFTTGRVDLVLDCGRKWKTQLFYILLRRHKNFCDKITYALHVLEFFGEA